MINERPFTPEEVNALISRNEIKNANTSVDVNALSSAITMVQEMIESVNDQLIKYGYRLRGSTSVTVSSFKPILKPIMRRKEGSSELEDYNIFSQKLDMSISTQLNTITSQLGYINKFVKQVIEGGNGNFESGGSGYTSLQSLITQLSNELRDALSKLDNDLRSEITATAMEEAEQAGSEAMEEAAEVVTNSEGKGSDSSDSVYEALEMAEDEVDTFFGLVIDYENQAKEADREANGYFGQAADIAAEQREDQQAMQEAGAKISTGQDVRDLGQNATGTFTPGTYSAGGGNTITVVDNGDGTFTTTVTNSSGEVVATGTSKGDGTGVTPDFIEYMGTDIIDRGQQQYDEARERFDEKQERIDDLTEKGRDAQERAEDARSKEEEARERLQEANETVSELNTPEATDEELETGWRDDSATDDDTTQGNDDWGDWDSFANGGDDE